MTTYRRGSEVINSSEIYDDFFKKRDVTEIIQYATKVFGRAIKDLSVEYQLHYWGHGDRYYKLASTYYNDFRLWWIIAQSNQLGEGNINVPPGTKLRIPQDIQSILRNLEQINKER